MEMLELSRLLFLDSVLAALVLPTGGEFILHAVLAFPEYDPLQMQLIAGAGYVVGLIFNAALGYGLMRLIMNEPWFSDKMARHYDLVSGYAARYGVFVLILFAAMPALGGAVTFLAGAARLHVSLLILTPILSRFLWIFLLFV